MTTVLFDQDIDLFSFVHLAKEWKLDFIQLRPGVFKASIAQIINDDFQLAYAELNTATKQEGKSPEGFWTFAFINSPVYWRNFVVPADSIIIYQPGSEINAINEDDFDVYTFSISEKHLKATSQKMNSESLIDDLKNHEILKITDLKRNEFRDTIKEYISKYKSMSPNDSTSHLKKFILEQMSVDLIELLKIAEPINKKLSSKNRLQLLKDVEKMMIENLSEQISVKEVAKHFEISERTLLYAFKARYAMGAKQYFKVIRLNSVFHILRSGIELQSISSAARKTGFWHMGQFFKDYREMFRELPSETVLKKNENNIKLFTLKD